MKKVKIGVVVVIVLAVVMAFTSPDKDAHFEEYLKSSSISSMVVNAVKGNESYTNLFLLSYYKRDDYFSLGLFGKVFVLQSG